MKKYTVKEIREILENQELVFPTKSQQNMAAIINGVAIYYDEFSIEKEMTETSIFFYINKELIAVIPLDEIKKIS